MVKMRYKQLIVFLLVGSLIIGMFLAGVWIKNSPQKRLEQKYLEFKELYMEKLYQSYNLSDAEDIALKAKEAYEKGDYESANEFLDQAFTALKSAKRIITTVYVPSYTQKWIYDGPIYRENLHLEQDMSFKAFTQRIPDLKKLGLKTIFLAPVWDFTAKNNCCVVNYYKIDSLLGNEKDLHELIETAHRNEIKVIFSLVTTIAPQKSVIYQEHPEWVLHDKRGKILNHYPHKSWGPAIDRANPEVIDYFAAIAKYYVQEYDIEGWYIDAPQNNYDPVVVSRDHNMTKMLRKIKQEIANIKPDAILLSEWQGPLCEGNPGGEPLFDEISEISYDWSFIGSLRPEISNLKLLFTRYKIPELKKYHFYYTGFVNELITNKATSEDLVNYFSIEPVWYNRTRARYIELHEPYRVQLGFPGQHKSLLVLILTIPGVPLIQNGQEIGEENTWGCNRDKGDYELWKFYKKVFKIRRENDALKYGSMSNVWSGGDNTYAYLRSYNNNHVISVINFHDHTVSSTLSLPVDIMGIDVNEKYGLHDALNNEIFFVNGLELSNFTVNLPAYGSRILILQN